MERRFHIVPEFYKTENFLNGRRIRKVTLQVECSVAELVVPNNEIEMHNPYPNKNYFVAGTKDTKCGWVSELPDGVSEFELKFTWNIYLSSENRPFVVVQNLHITLEDDGPGFYSMCAMTWRREGRPLDMGVRGVGTLEDVSEYRKSNSLVEHKFLFEGDIKTGMVLSERVVINALEINSGGVGESYYVNLRV